MRIRLAYGKTGLMIDLPDDRSVTVVEPRFVPGMSEAREALRQALRAPLNSPPLCELAKPTDKVGIIFSDITRPTPHHLLIPAVLKELAHVPRENITLFNALGTHRPNTETELRGMLSDELFDNYRIVQNNSLILRRRCASVSSSRGHDVWLNREIVDVI
jgi:nickel-dependent lactate racemase